MADKQTDVFFYEVWRSADYRRMAEQLGSFDMEVDAKGYRDALKEAHPRQKFQIIRRPQSATAT